MSGKKVPLATDRHRHMQVSTNSKILLALLFVSLVVHDQQRKSAARLENSIRDLEYRVKWMGRIDEYSVRIPVTDGGTGEPFKGVMTILPTRTPKDPHSPSTPWMFSFNKAYAEDGIPIYYGRVSYPFRFHIFAHGYEEVFIEMPTPAATEIPVTLKPVAKAP